MKTVKFLTPLFIILSLLVVGSASAEKVNLPVKTFGGKQLWTDQKVLGGWRIQKSILSDHYRLLDDDDVRVAWGSRSEMNAAWLANKEQIGKSSETPLRILLIHGLGRSRQSMNGLKEGLEDQGFDVEAVQYPSTRLSLEDHARQVGQVIEAWEVQELVIVTHSLGGLVTRKMIEMEQGWRSKTKLRSVVMIAPPNQGAAISDYLQKYSLFGTIMGKAGLETRTIDASSLPVPDVPFAIIAGGKGDKKGYNPLLEGDDDGVVRVEETSLEGQTDYLLRPQYKAYFPV